MTATVFNTLDGTAWAKALTAARKRRKGQGKRIAEAVAKWRNAQLFSAKTSDNLPAH